MKMKELLLFLCFLSVSADGLHEDMALHGCSYSDAEAMYGLDGEEVWYADFKNQKGVDAQPPFVDRISYSGAYENAVALQKACKENLQVCWTAMKGLPIEHDAPSAVMVYTRDEVEPGVQNTLVCHVTGFYPAPVNISWTKNGVKVTEGASINVAFPNKDWTFTQISRLVFIPEVGDIYSCGVEHPTLTRPTTKIYDVKDRSVLGVIPAVFCGVGLTVALFGLAAGTFFFVKGCERS